MDPTLNISLTGQPSPVSDRPTVWVRLEQEGHPDIAQAAGFNDIFQMFSMARGGISAWGYIKDDCPMEVDAGIVRIALDFWSFPSSMDLAYSVGASIGVLGEPIRVELAREFDLVLDRQRVELPYTAQGVTTEWLTPAFDRNWRQVARPALTAEDAALVLSEPLGFAAVRVRCQALGYLHTVVLELVKDEETTDEDGNINTTGYTIENLACVITAAWTDEDGQHQTEVMELKIPKCVEDYLATCEGGGRTKVGIVRKDEERRTIVYYNSCTGTVLDIRYQ